ncbi:DUF2207 domain-containing protein [Lagierella sp.]|uniref:DUF2207 family protein n=1 Tax=Lagierella sp. TaxID=2849657 RepID=UPI00261244E6|nr:DUF2207 domain-containing protein [Lagierella sp.]
MRFDFIKKRFIVSLLALFLLIFPIKINAESNKITNMEMETRIHKDGFATITSTIDLHQYSGTEFYIPMGDMRDSKIVDFQVFENGVKFEDMGRNWNVNDSIEDKKNKSGIYNNNGQDELVMGIGSYGQHQFTLVYKISNFVRKTSDGELLTFWKYVNDSFNMPIENFNLKIVSDVPFNKEDLRIWGFGYVGETQIHEDFVSATSHETIGETNYVTVLYKLPKGSIDTSSTIDKTYTDIVKGAKEGSSFIQENDVPLGSWKKFISVLIMTLGIPFVAILTALFTGRFIANKAKRSKKANKMKRKLKGQYYRDIPTEHTGSELYDLLYRLDYGNFTNFLTGYFLKWIHEGAIETVKTQQGAIFKRQKNAFKINTISFNKRQKEDSLEDPKEVTLFYKLLEASEDGLLESNEFSLWARKNERELRLFQDGLFNFSENRLLALGYYQKNPNRTLFRNNEFIETPEGEELMSRVIRFRNYLKNFSLLNERESYNVHLWDKYMIWAGFLGITEEVRKEFSKLYPEIEYEELYNPDTITVAHDMARTAYYAAFEYSSSSSRSGSSGYGGSSSIGGGGGSFGGGSGGGAR